MSDAASNASTVKENDQLGFDPDVLRAKYRAERDKRVRADGNDQYIEVKGDFSRYIDDPYVGPASRARRSPTRSKL